MSIAIPPITAVITDIEGTTTPISFVRDTLFPYARAHLPEFLARHPHDSEVITALREVSPQALAAAEQKEAA